jgi:hypothetical protein
MNFIVMNYETLDSPKSRAYQQVMTHADRMNTLYVAPFAFDGHDHFGMIEPSQGFFGAHESHHSSTRFLIIGIAPWGLSDR